MCFMILKVIHAYCRKLGKKKKKAQICVCLIYNTTCQPPYTAAGSLFTKHTLVFLQRLKHSLDYAPGFCSHWLLLLITPVRSSVSFCAFFSPSSCSFKKDPSHPRPESRDQVSCTALPRPLSMGAPELFFLFHSFKCSIASV